MSDEPVDDDHDDPDDNVPWAGDRVARRQAHAVKQRARVQAVLVGATFLLLVSVVPVLIYVGYHQIYDSTSGRRLNPIDDPTEAGYEVNVAPTPVQLVGEVDRDGALIGVAVLALGTGDAGGGVLFVPAETVVPADAGGGTIASQYAEHENAGLSRGAGAVLHTGFDSVAVIDASRWADLVGPVAPLAVQNPDRLPGPDGTGTAFPAGKITIPASQVGAYVAARRPGESELNRLARHNLLWAAWLGAVATAGPGAVPGETSSGLGKFLTTLAAGRITYAQLPVAPVTPASPTGEAFQASPDAVRAAIAALIPFPTGDQPGQRVRLRVLDGVGSSGLSVRVARQLVSEGGEVVLVGNADHFGYATSEVRYADDSFADEAAALAQALGGATVTKTKVLDDVVDLTVVVGSDFVAREGGGTTTVSERSSGG